jgi:hypothetical protein
MKVKRRGMNEQFLLPMPIAYEEREPSLLFPGWEIM